MFKNKSMPVVGKYQSKVFPFSLLRNYLFLPEDDTNKYTSALIGDMEVTETKALLDEIRD